MIENQIAFVTGGTAGIGKSIAHKFAQSKARVYLFGTHSERGQSAVQEIQKATSNPSVFFHQLDVSKTQTVEETLKRILAETGGVDILVNNAGIYKDQLLMKMTEEEWDSVINVNLKSCYNMCHNVIRSMLKAKKGKIINVSSVVGLTGNTGQVNYASSKAAIIGFTRSLAKEVASRNIHVNCIAPGFVKTAMTDYLTEEQQNELCKTIPLGRMGQPNDIANVALFLASNLSDYITGQVLTVDGGMVLGSSWS